MTTQEFIEAKRKEYKAMHADVFSGKLSPLYADKWLETYTLELVATTRGEIADDMKLHALNRKRLENGKIMSLIELVESGTEPYGKK